MAIIPIDKTSGAVNSAEGLQILNNRADVDVRKAVIFPDRQSALDSIDASVTFQRVEGLRLLVLEEGKIVEYIFDGGIADENFVRFGENSFIDGGRSDTNYTSTIPIDGGNS